MIADSVIEWLETRAQHAFDRAARLDLDVPSIKVDALLLLNLLRMLKDLRKQARLNQ